MKKVNRSSKGKNNLDRRVPKPANRKGTTGGGSANSKSKSKSGY